MDMGPGPSSQFNQNNAVAGVNIIDNFFLLMVIIIMYSDQGYHFNFGIINCRGIIAKSTIWF